MSGELPIKVSRPAVGVAEENPLNSACTSFYQTFDDTILDHVSNPITHFT